MDVLPLTMVNLLQNVSSKAMEHDATVTLKSASPKALEVDLGKMSFYDSVVNKHADVPVSKSDTDADNDSEGLQSVDQLMKNPSLKTSNLKNWC